MSNVDAPNNRADLTDFESELKGKGGESGDLKKKIKILKC